MEFLLLAFLPLLLMGGMNDVGEDESPTDGGADSPSDPDVVDEPSISRSGLIVPEAYFGTNAPYTVATDQGIPTDTFGSALEAFEIEYHRFPAGRGENSGDDGNDWLDISQLSEEGELRTELVDYLDNTSGQVTLVVSTTNAPLPQYGDNLAEWAEVLLNEYGDRIAAFEIGNEYWARMGETEYGQRASIAIEELAQGIENASQGNPEVLVQMASPYGQSEFHSSVSELGFVERLTTANNTIIDQLSEEAMSNVDGIVEHYYWVRGATELDGSSREFRYINIDQSIWHQRFDQELSLHITEWNIRSTNTEAIGLQGASVYLEMMENMLELGADAAHVWPLVHNTTNDLGGSASDGAVLADDQGRVFETIRGAVFDLLSEILPGSELVDVELAGLPANSHIATYMDDETVTFFLSNPSTELLNIELDLRQFDPSFTRATGVQIGYDPSSSDGTHWLPNLGRVDAAFVELDGERYHYNEPDVQARITDVEYIDPNVQIALLPYELFALQVHL